MDETLGGVWTPGTSRKSLLIDHIDIWKAYSSFQESSTYGLCLLSSPFYPSKTSFILPNHGTEFGIIKLSAIYMISQWTFRVLF